MYNYIIPFENYELDKDSNDLDKSGFNLEKISRDVSGKIIKNQDNNIISQVLDDNISTLRTLLSQISKEIEDRYFLGECLIKDINKKSCMVTAELFKVKNLHFGNDPSLERRLTSIEKELDLLDKEIRDRETERWRDIALLRKEFRIAYREYKKLSQRFNIIKTVNSNNNRDDSNE